MLLVVGSASKGRLQSQQNEGVGVWGWLSLRKNNSVTLGALSSKQTSQGEKQSRTRWFFNEPPEWPDFW